ncbi:alpha/beta family hydrolase [Skermania piniformis]|uniref:Alpha/beta hydrolase n=1 Tax=Skermania pinensis TaxID=39122 RepID=A0ABX8SDP4_9ACTN|nr:alpha/beta family hydrolase [Skermania piniformis]QXQ13786.1 alpha/beta hydrolase [Skermania piniformis]
MQIRTVAGPAEVVLDLPEQPRFLLLLTHGAGGGVDTKDLLAVRDTALALGGGVARVRQPYQVSGRRAPGATGPQDAAWLDVVTALREQVGAVPLIQGGRSNGARVACRTAAAAQVAGVLALSFPLHPPGKPERSRVDELRCALDHGEVVVINGERDPFGVPAPADATAVHVVRGQAHAFRRVDALPALVRPWLLRWSAT